MLRWIAYAAYVADELERERITHLHAHFAHDPTSVALTMNLLSGIAYSFTAHAFDIHLTPKAELGYKMQRARFVVTCTAYNQRFLTELDRQRYSGHVHCIHHGIGLRSLPPPASSPQVPPLILAVARLTEKKGLTYLLRACRVLLDRGYEFVCRIVGEGPLRPTLEREIRELALESRVQLWGADTQEQVFQQYQQATIVALPCVVAESGDRDGIPNVLVEAMAMGVPVVSTPISGIPELITEECDGLLVPPHDFQSLAEALVRLLDDSQLHERLASAARQTVTERFDLTQNVARLRELLSGAEPC